MQRRGEIIRNEIPNFLRSSPATGPNNIEPFKGRLNVQGRDGTGKKTFVPWVRVHSPELSPSAQNGWYVVYLFHQDGSGVSLCLMHGSTKFNGADFVPRSHGEALELKKWAQNFIFDDASALGFSFDVDLGSTESLAKAYERTTAVSKTYPLEEIPANEELEADLARALGLLGQIYEAINHGAAPESESPEILDAQLFIDEVANPIKGKTAYGGQGFGLNAEQRRAVELRAMDVAREWLSESGFESITDTSAKHPYDFTAYRDGVQHIVEVKGTTSLLGKILLTANEVAAHSQWAPNNLLIVISQIQLLEMRTKAVGGKLTVWEGWRPKPDELQPLCFAYRCASLAIT